MVNFVAACVKATMQAAAQVYFPNHCLLDKEKLFSKTIAS
jgi:hypothetical protein